MKAPRLRFAWMILFFSACCVSTHAEVRDAEVLPVLCVELDGFGFRGDYLRIRFEKGFEKAWEESSLPYQLEFKSFPVKDYRGNPAIELKLNYWQSLFLGYRTLNFWAAYVSPDGEKNKLDIIQHEGRTGVAMFYSSVERSYEDQSHDATLLLLEKVKPLLGDL